MLTKFEEKLDKEKQAKAGLDSKLVTSQKQIEKEVTVEESEEQRIAAEEAERESRNN